MLVHRVSASSVVLVQTHLTSQEVSAVNVKSGLAFGVSVGSNTVINYGSVSDAFSTAAVATNMFTLAVPGAASTLGTVAFGGTTAVYLTFGGIAAGVGITMLGGAGLTQAFASSFLNGAGTNAAGTLLFGTSATTGAPIPTFS